MTPDEIVRALREMATYDCGYEEESDAAMAAIDLIESLQTQLADYHHMSELVDGKMEENQRLRRINENLQAQLAASQRREKAAVEDLVAMAECKLLGTCTFCAHRNTPDARYAPCKGCIQPNRSCLHFEWRGPQEAGEGETE